MKKKMIKLVKRFVLYMLETWKQKLWALVLMACASVPMFIDGDATALVLVALFAVPGFFVKSRWIN